VQIIAIGLYILPLPDSLFWLQIGAMALAVILTIVTGLDYLVRAWHVYATAKTGHVDQPPAPGAG